MAEETNSWEQQQIRTGQIINQDRRDAIVKLRAAGIEIVEWEYNGSGDSGSLDLQTTLSPDVKGDVENIGYHVLESHFAGWEINEGSFGEMEWDIVSDNITIKHNARVESSVYSEKSDVGDGAPEPEEL